jgi:hypothetical protein
VYVGIYMEFTLLFGGQTQGYSCTCILMLYTMYISWDKVSVAFEMDIFALVEECVEQQEALFLCICYLQS